MFNLSQSEIDDDIAHLMRESPEVVEAINALDHQIHNEIQTYQLENGSRVVTHAFDELSSTEEYERVMHRFDGRYYERIKTCTQYRVVWDETDDELYVFEEQHAFEEQLVTQHICIPRPRQSPSTDKENLTWDSPPQEMPRNAKLLFVKKFLRISRRQ